MNPTALGGAGLALGVASSMLGGKQKSKWEPKFRTDNGYYEMSMDMGKTWNPVPKGYEKRPTDNAKLRAGEILGVPRNPNEVPLPNGQVMDMATRKISYGTTPHQFDVRNPYQLKEGDYRLPNGSILNMYSNKVVNNPNVNNTSPYYKEDRMIQGFGKFMQQNQSSYFKDGPAPDAGALATAEAAKAKKYNSLLSKSASRTSTATTSSILAQAKG